MIKKFLMSLGYLGIISSLVMPIACSPQNKTAKSDISKDVSYEAQITFLDNVFNSNYLQNILLKVNFKEVRNFSTTFPQIIFCDFSQKFHYIIVY